MLDLIFRFLGKTIKSLNRSKSYIIDMFPVAVCRNIRIPKCSLLKNQAYRAFNNSKKEYFYGFKVQIITTNAGTPVQLDIFCGATGAITAFQCTQIAVPQYRILYSDKAYNDYSEENLLAECEQIYLKPHRKSNSKRKAPI